MKPPWETVYRHQCRGTTRCRGCGRPLGGRHQPRCLQAYAAYAEAIMGLRVVMHEDAVRQSMNLPRYQAGGMGPTVHITVSEAQGPLGHVAAAMTRDAIEAAQLRRRL